MSVKQINIFDFASSIGTEFVFEYWKTRGTYTANFRECLVVSHDERGMVLKSMYGKGTTLEEAIQDYIKNIQGRFVVIGDAGKEALRIDVPFLYLPEKREDQWKK